MDEEPVTWILRFGKQGAVSQVYKGSATSWSKSAVAPGTTFWYQLVATNRFGDSTVDSGKVRSVHRAPPSSSWGIPWNTSVTYGYFVDSRDKQGYYTVKIGNLTWMAQNLNYGGPMGDVGVCLNNSADSCMKYGRLYTWEEARAGAAEKGVPRICPDDWHLPSEDEWRDLDRIARDSVVGSQLRSRGAWPNSRSVDAYGFRALPAGKEYGGGTFYGNGKETKFWFRPRLEPATSEPSRPSWYLHGDGGSFAQDEPKENHVSLRCLHY